MRRINSIEVYASGAVAANGSVVARIIPVDGRSMLSRIDRARPQSMVPADDAVDVGRVLGDPEKLHAAIRAYLVPPLVPPLQLAAIGGALYGRHWQTDLAEALGVNKRTVQRWAAAEKRPSRKALAAIADLCRLRARALKAAAREVDRVLAGR